MRVNLFSTAMEQRSCCSFISLVSTFFLIASSSAYSLPTSPFLGINPQEEKYYTLEVIKCKDESNFFTKDRLNDGFCDCADGTDEPGTSACPESKFYCRNIGTTPQLLFSSQVNDQLCDCCDGSDEYDGGINCPNTCVKDGNIFNNNDDHNSTKTDRDGSDTADIRSSVSLEDLIQKLKELKIIVIGEAVFVSCLVAFRLFRWRVRSRRRQYH